MSTHDLPPSDEVLRQFLLGQLPPEELEVVGRFLQANPNTLSTLNAMNAGDTLLDALRSAAATAHPDSAEMVEVMARAEALFVANRADENLTIDFAATVDAAETGTNADLTAILAPPEQAGELGRLGEYRILRVLGRGGMGAVFEAEDAKLGRRVAIKVMLPALAANPNAKKRFLQEARTAAKVEHDHIVPIYQIGEFRGAPFLAMPLLVGETLDDRLRDCRPLATADALRIGRQVAEGLGAAHDAGLIHRDIKPSNIWLEQHADGAFKRVRILDFGLARLTTERDAITHAGAILGTPAYMAPEQARGLAVDSRADLFSLGCVLYQMTTGLRPFKGNDTFAILTALATEAPPPPSALNAEVPPAFSDLIVRLLAKTPDARPQSAREVIAALDGIASEPLSHVASKDVTGMWVPVPSPRKPRRKWLIAAGVLFLALLAVTAYNAETIVRVANNEGELIVEVDDPNVEVVVKGEGVEIRREENGKKRVFLVKAGKDGEVEVREPGSEVVLVMEKFRVTRAGKTEVIVTAEKLAAGRVNPVQPGVMTTDQRKALEWVLKQPSGGISILQGGKEVSLKHQDILPQEPFTLVDVSFSVNENGKTIYDATTLSNLDRLPPVVGTLFFYGTNLTDSGLKHITGQEYAQSISGISLYVVPVTPNGLIALKRLQRLTYCHLSGLRLNDDALTHIKGLSKLNNLGLDGFGITDVGLQHLVGLSELRSLDIKNNKVTKAGVEKFSAALPLCRIESDFGTFGPKEKSAKPLQYKNPLGMEFALVPRGKSWLGGGGDVPGTKEVVVPIDFYFGLYPVTQEQWKEVTGGNPSFFARDGVGLDAVKAISDADLERFPAERMSFAAVEEFFTKLNQRDKQDGWVYRLPTGEEWEYACRGGPLTDKSQSAFDYYLDKPSHTLRPDQAHFGYKGALQRTYKVGQFTPNPLGLYDMHGNVLEWCSDAKLSPDGKPLRMVRGGSWNDFAGSAAAEKWFLPSVQYGSIGVRVVRSRIDSNLNRKLRQLAGGNWRMEGNELVQAKPGVANLMFGDPNWTDYDLTLETKTLPCSEKPQGGLQFFRCTGPNNYLDFSLGAYFGTFDEVAHMLNGKWGRDQQLLRTVHETNRWYKVEVQVRGSQIRCLLDGQLSFEFEETRFPKGYIGLGTYNSAVRWKNLKVTSPDGRRLYEGFPDLNGNDPDRKAVPKLPVGASGLEPKKK